MTDEITPAPAETVTPAPSPEPAPDESADSDSALPPSIYGIAVVLYALLDSADRLEHKIKGELMADLHAIAAKLNAVM